ncbi:tumor necrosis factor receptor superfamily member 9a [Myripristis murdjan]|uniref:tumor necrosis factor receptor superfamily member 9a n=1 Tax=Myripristis murdjan TaxID=586833 RepID=UPI001175F2C1|nr:tumor necrosis factor receptor superfamily member 9-like [Myripristis murdjan]
MSMILWAIGLSLLIQGCVSSAGDSDKGCMRWSPKGQTDVCCDMCHPGNRIFNRCGQDPKQLCVPCEEGTFTTEPRVYSCSRCSDCTGAQVVKKACTSTSDTVCGCQDGLQCGDATCSFCVTTCGKGEEPVQRSCRPCANGTFNDKIHEKCKPWRTSCPHPDQHLIGGDAVSDRMCSTGNVTPPGVRPVTKQEDQTDLSMGLVAGIVVCICIILIIISLTMMVKMKIKRKKSAKEPKKTPVIRTPTDDPRTLIAIECSFHEAQQEQGSSTESLASKDSKNPLIA